MALDLENWHLQKDNGETDDDDDEHEHGHNRIVAAVYLAWQLLPCHWPVNTTRSTLPGGVVLLASDAGDAATAAAATTGAEIGSTCWSSRQQTTGEEGSAAVATSTTSNPAVHVPRWGTDRHHRSDPSTVGRCQGNNRLVVVVVCPEKLLPSLNQEDDNNSNNAITYIWVDPLTALTLDQDNSTTEYLLLQDVGTIAGHGTFRSSQEVFRFDDLVYFLGW
jgi:hypothetical protein